MPRTMRLIMFTVWVHAVILVLLSSAPALVSAAAAPGGNVVAISTDSDVWSRSLAPDSGRAAAHDDLSATSVHNTVGIRQAGGNNNFNFQVLQGIIA